MSSFTTPLKYEFTGSYRNGNPLYIITEEFTYVVDSLDNPFTEITVPAGFITDLASVPFPLSKIFKPDGRWAKAAVIHDYLYENYSTDPVTRIIYDAIFLEGMIVLGLNRIFARIVHSVIRTFHFFKNLINKLRG